MKKTRHNHIFMRYCLFVVIFTVMAIQRPPVLYAQSGSEKPSVVIEWSVLGHYGRVHDTSRLNDISPYSGISITAIEKAPHPTLISDSPVVEEVELDAQAQYKAYETQFVEINTTLHKPYPPIPLRKPVSVVMKEMVVFSPLPTRRPKTLMVDTAFMSNIEENIITTPVNPYVIRQSSDAPVMPAVPQDSVVSSLMMQAEELAPTILKRRKVTSRITVAEIAPQAGSQARTIAAAPTHYKSVIIPDPATKSVIVPLKKPEIIRSASEIIRSASYARKSTARKASIPVSRAVAYRQAYGAMKKPALKEVKQQAFMLAFAKGSSAIGGHNQKEIVERILPILRNKSKLRLQIKAFAAPIDHNYGSARRISLSRALAIRTLLLKYGIAAQRIDVRAFGMQTGREPADYVDMVLYDPERRT